MQIGMPAMPVTNAPIRKLRRPIFLNSLFRSRLNSSSLVSATVPSMPLETKKSRTDGVASPQIILALASEMTFSVRIVALTKTLSDAPPRAQDCNREATGAFAEAKGRRQNRHNSNQTRHACLLF